LMVFLKNPELVFFPLVATFVLIFLDNWFGQNKDKFQVNFDLIVWNNYFGQIMFKC
jgi:hypothetical protein